ncbi:hypothetical protein chiPu_0028067, partial [Chiloscyllium punctatum]|nr:hypothetical protein [Chiloscyllium punctatum]
MKSGTLTSWTSRMALSPRKGRTGGQGARSPTAVGCGAATA